MMIVNLKGETMSNQQLSNIYKHNYIVIKIKGGNTYGTIYT